MAIEVVFNFVQIVSDSEAIKRKLVTRERSARKETNRIEVLVTLGSFNSKMMKSDL